MNLIADLVGVARAAASDVAIVGATDASVAARLARAADLATGLARSTAVEGLDCISGHMQSRSIERNDDRSARERYAEPSDHRAPPQSPSIALRSVAVYSGIAANHGPEKKASFARRYSSMSPPSNFVLRASYSARKSSTWAARPFPMD